MINEFELVPHKIFDYFREVMAGEIQSGEKRRRKTSTREKTGNKTGKKTGKKR